jgi:hypothetical protein
MLDSSITDPDLLKVIDETKLTGNEERAAYEQETAEAYKCMLFRDRISP